MHKSLQPQPPEHDEIPLDRIAAITAGGPGDEHGIQMVLHFTEATKLGKRLRFNIRPEQALTFVRWWQETHPPKKANSASD